MVEPEESTIAWQGHNKHVSAATEGEREVESIVEE
jgi:hypothetical protein